MNTYEETLKKALEDLLEHVYKLPNYDGADAPSYVEGNKLVAWDGMMTVQPDTDYADILVFEAWPWADTKITGRAPLHEYYQLKHIMQAVEAINHGMTMQS